MPIISYIGPFMVYFFWILFSEDFSFEEDELFHLLNDENAKSITFSLATLLFCIACQELRLKI